MRKSLILAAVAMAALAGSAKAAIFLTVSGGKGDPLTIDITGGDSFTATADHDGTGLFLFFVDLWDNSVVSQVSGAAVATVSLDGSTSASTTGAVSGGGYFPSDMVLGFSSSTAFSDGDPIVLTTGTRTTGSSLNLDYTTVGVVSGIAEVVDAGGNVLSNQLAYQATIVPEPASYSMLFGVLTLGLVVLRRRVRK